MLRQDLHLDARGFVYQSFNQFVDGGHIADQDHIWNRMQSDVRGEIQILVHLLSFLTSLPFQFKCCGSHGITDFSELVIPWSCYNRPAPGEGLKIMYDRGCLNVLVNHIKSQLLVIACAAMALCLLQVRNEGVEERDREKSFYDTESVGT